MFIVHDNINNSLQLHSSKRRNERFTACNITRVIENTTNSYETCERNKRELCAKNWNDWHGKKSIGTSFHSCTRTASIRHRNGLRHGNEIKPNQTKTKQNKTTTHPSLELNTVRSERVQERTVATSKVKEVYICLYNRKCTYVTRFNNNRKICHRRHRRRHQYVHHPHRHRHDPVKVLLHYPTCSAQLRESSLCNSKSDTNTASCVCAFPT